MKDIPAHTLDGWASSRTRTDSLDELARMAGADGVRQPCPRAHALRTLRSELKGYFKQERVALADLAWHTSTAATGVSRIIGYLVTIRSGCCQKLRANDRLEIGIEIGRLVERSPTPLSFVNAAARYLALCEP